MEQVVTQSRRDIRAAQLAGDKGRPQRAGNGNGNGRSAGTAGFADGEGEGRTGWKKWVLGTLKWGSIAAAVLLVLGVVGVVIDYNQTAIPQANEQVSIVYYSDGKTELDRIAVQDGNRESVKLKQVPKFVQDAHIAAEDRTFYQNNGISVGGILRAVKTSVTGETQVGGSTITQQYVKNYFLTQDRTISRKAKEILIAVKIDGQLSKSEILEKYLNTIYYGRGAYGIQSAAKAYFGKNVSQLTVGEGAVLASVLNAPTLYDPAQGPAAEANLTKRYAYVLDGMVQEGWLSAADRAKYAALPKILPYKGNKFSSGPNGFITSQVKNELLSTGLSEQDIDKGGLRIVTTIANFGGRSYGMVDMRRMIGRSINTAFVNLNNTIKPALTRQAAIDAGIPEKTPGLDDTLTNVLGTASPHVIDMATAYSTIASQGVRAKPYFVKKVISTTSDFSYEAKPQTKRAFDKDVTADVTDAMTYTVKDGGTATKLQRLGRPVAGKTGTSSYAKSIWFSGFVPQLAVSIGMDKPDAHGNPQTLTSSEDTNLTGGTVPADVFYDFMKVALQGMEVQDFPARAGVGDDKIPTPTTTFTPPPTTTTHAPTTTTTQAPSTTTTQAPTT